MRPIFYRISLLLGGLLFTVPYLSNAQFIGDDIFMKGDYIEVGIAKNQQFGTKGDAPAEYHDRTGGVWGYMNSLGFVSDPSLDGWEVGAPSFVGDYFLPGYPQEGWDMSIDGVWVRAYAGDWSAGTPGLIESGGSLTPTPDGENTDYYIEGTKKVAVWEGQLGNLEVITTTSFDTTQVFFVVSVKLKNVGTETTEDVYYSRTLDPDQESTFGAEGLSSTSTTTNVIEFQPDESTGDLKALVSATGIYYPDVCYLGLGAVDCRAQVYIYPGALNPSVGPDAIETSSFNKGVGYSNELDCAIGIVFNLGDFEPGDSTVFSYAYILSSEDLDLAFATLSASLNIDEFGYASGDTIFACVGDTVDIAVVGGEQYDWDTWLPGEGLIYPPGRENSVIVGPDTITYSIIGVTAECEIYDTLQITIAPYVLKDPGLDSTIEMCGNLPTINLITLLAGEPETGGVWTGPGVSADGFFTPGGLDEGSYIFTYTHTTGACDTSATVTIQVVNDVDLDFTYDILEGCDEDSVQFTNNSDSIVYFRWNFGDGSEHDTTNFSPLHIYEDQDDYEVWLVGMNERGCIDSMMRIVEINHPLQADFTQSADSVCQGDNTVTFSDGSIGNIQSWQWDFGDGNSSADQNPTHSYAAYGTYTIRMIVTDHVPCSDTAYATVYVDSVADIEISVDKEEICGGDQIRINAEYMFTTEELTWDFGDGSVAQGITNYMTHNYPTPGTYYISVTSDHPVCPSVTAVDTVSVKQYPQINLGSDTQLCLKGAPLFIDPTIMVDNPPGTIYYWSTGDSAAVLKITEPGTYRITANLDGCITTDEFEVNKDCYTDIPNSFTPNGDGNNDYFYPRQLLSEGVIDFKMTIYNRWGEVVFETANPDGRGWDGKFDGKEQPMGVYVYQISVRYKNQAAEKYTGNVTLLR